MSLAMPAAGYVRKVVVQAGHGWRRHGAAGAVVFRGKRSAEWHGRRLRRVAGRAGVVWEQRHNGSHAFARVRFNVNAMASAPRWACLQGEQLPARYGLLSRHAGTDTRHACPAALSRVTSGLRHTAYAYRHHTSPSASSIPITSQWLSPPPNIAQLTLNVSIRIRRHHHH